MGYRNDLGAAHARAASLEARVEALTASSAADAEALAQAREELEAARRELAALEVYSPGSAARRAAPYRLVIAAALAFVVATAVAGSMAERFGVAMSHLAAAALGAGFAGWLGAQRSRSFGVAAAVLGALLGLAAAVLFYESIWPSL